MTAVNLVTERQILARSRHGSRAASSRRRLIFVLLAFAHAMACRLIQDQVLAQSGVFEYMGLHWIPANMGIELLFLALAVAPALMFIPVEFKRASDLLLIIVYGTVYVPATALFPNVTVNDTGEAVALTLLCLVGLYIATRLARLEPGGGGSAFGLADNRYDLMLFCAAGAVIASYVAFVPIQVVEFDLTRVYEFRAAFGDQMSKLSPIMLYVFVNAALGLSPMMIVRGLTRKNYIMVAVAFGLAFYTFAVTSYRSLLFVAGFVAALTYLIRLKVPPAVSIFGFFVAVAVGTVTLDAIANAAIPTNTFSIHYRLFGNSATITSAYLDLFSNHQKFYYSQSFLRFLIRPPTDIPYPLLVGHEISTVENVWANGNMVADAFANLGYVGVFLTFVLLGLFLAGFNFVAQAKDKVVAALTLAAPGFYLSNGGLQSAVLSGGLGVTVLLVVLYPTTSFNFTSRFGKDAPASPGQPQLEAPELEAPEAEASAGA